MLPAIVVIEAQIDLDEGPPLGPAWFADEVHADFLRGVVRLAGIASDAGADDVFPGGRAAAVAGNDVVKIQVLAIKRLAAILAGVVIALENVVPGELDFLLGQAVKDSQQNDSRNPDPERNGVDAFGVWLLLG